MTVQARIREDPRPKGIMCRFMGRSHSYTGSNRVHADCMNHAPMSNGKRSISMAAFFKSNGKHSDYEAANFEGI